MPKPGHAEYMQRYRATVKPMRERQARQQGVDEAMAQAYAFLREFIGERQVNGFEAAHMLRKRFGFAVEVAGTTNCDTR